MELFTKKILVTTHDGRYHADDLFATATLRLMLGKLRVVRTRDPKIISEAKYVVDVGGVYDTEKNRFDHHQKGGAGERENGIPYASFGLVWKTYGEKISGSKEVAERVDARLVAPIDADDNGFSLSKNEGPAVPYTLQGVIYAFRPTWKEDSTMYDQSFSRLLRLAEKVIEREVVIARDALEAESIVMKAYYSSADKRVVELDSNYPYQETLTKYSEPLYVILPRQDGSVWKVETVRVNTFGFENRKSFPAEWAGLRDEDLARVSGVQDAMFCHNGRFLCVAKSKQGALALAKRALEANC